jgi:hypothetical protein
LRAEWNGGVQAVVPTGEVHQNENAILGSRRCAKGFSQRAKLRRKHMTATDKASNFEEVATRNASSTFEVIGSAVDDLVGHR